MVLTMETFAVDVIKSDVPTHLIKVNPEPGIERFLEMDLKLGNKTHHQT